MSKYVNVDDIFDALYPVDPECDGSDGCTVILQNLTFTSADIEGLIDQIPSADVAPVVHGKWIHDENYVDWAEQYKCSVCNGHALTDGDYRHKLSDYCPNCGARMDLMDLEDSK